MEGEAVAKRDTEPVYAEEDLLAYQRYDNGSDVYLVKWVGYEETTWVADDNLGDVPEQMKTAAQQRSIRTPLLLTITATLQEDTWQVFATNEAGEEKCQLNLKSFQNFATLQGAIEQRVNQSKKFSITLAGPDSRVMDFAHAPRTTMNEIFQAGNVEGDMWDKIIQLVAMGFQKADAHAALEQCGGDMQVALDILAAGDGKATAPKGGHDADGGSAEGWWPKPQTDLDQKVANLVNMGFGEEEARAMLERESGDLQRSMDALLTARDNNAPVIMVSPNTS